MKENVFIILLLLLLFLSLIFLLLIFLFSYSKSFMNSILAISKKSFKKVGKTFVSKLIEIRYPSFDLTKVLNLR